MDSTSKLSNAKYNCFYLDWDTNYFGVNSARVILKEWVPEVDQNKILQYCKNFEFITITNKNNLKENNYWIGKKTNAFLTDMNMQFIKIISQESTFADEQTEVYSSYPNDGKIINIAKSAFKFSRFFSDPELPADQAQNIYLNWTKGAFGHADKHFVIARRNGEIAGYVLFSIDNEERYASIELIAVDNIYQGKQVGKSLISKLESFLYKNGINKIKVGTQVDNITAIRFYTTCGFQYEECNSIYHLWAHK